MAVSDPTWRHPRAKRPAAVRVAALNKLGDLHTRWVAGAAATATFTPGAHPKQGSDYGLHHVDLDAAPAKQDDFHHRAGAIITALTAGVAARDPALVALLDAWPHLAADLVAELSTVAAALAAAGNIAALGTLAASPTTVGALTDAVTEAMQAAATAATVSTLREAPDGGDPTAVVQDHDRLAAVAAVTVGIITAGYAAAAAREALQVPARILPVLMAMSTAVTAAGLVAASLGAALVAATHAGRIAVFRVRVPLYLLATERDDPNECAACARVDGTRYPTLDAALIDYPGYGGYRNCAGGARCRGSLRAVWR